MSDSELMTEPSLETILDRINAEGAMMRASFEKLEETFQVIEERLERMENRLDRVQGAVLEVWADQREFRATFK
jgi:archaellum component FlaC